MALVEKEIRELSELSHLITTGAISYTRARLSLRTFEQRLERVKFVGFARLADPVGFAKAKIVSDGSVLAVTQADVAKELIDCEIQGIIITREKCHDFSGKTKNASACQDCPNFPFAKKQKNIVQLKTA